MIKTECSTQRPARAMCFKLSRASLVLEYSEQIGPIVWQNY